MLFLVLQPWVAEPQFVSGSFLRNLSSCNLPIIWSCDSFVEDLAWDMATTASVGEKGRGKLRPVVGADKCDRRRGPSCGEGGWLERAAAGAVAGAHGELIGGGEGIFPY